MKQVILGVVGALLLGGGAVFAGTWAGWQEHFAEVRPQQPALTLIVYEADGCRYCSVLRDALLPRYQNTEFERRAPVRFVNLSADGSADHQAAAPITMVPTAVLFHGGREVDRITGYAGPERLLQLVATYLQNNS